MMCTPWLWFRGAQEPRGWQRSLRKQEAIPPLPVTWTLGEGIVRGSGRWNVYSAEFYRSNKEGVAWIKSEGEGLGMQLHDRACVQHVGALGPFPSTPTLAKNEWGWYGEGFRWRKERTDGKAVSLDLLSIMRGSPCGGDEAVDKQGRTNASHSATVQKQFPCILFYLYMLNSVPCLASKQALCLISSYPLSSPSHLLPLASLVL